MRPVYFGLVVNVVLVLLKYFASTSSTSASINASLLHSLADLTVSGLIALGVALQRLKPSLRYPFGYGRAVYVTGFAAVVIVVAYLFLGAVSEGVNRLADPVVEVSEASKQLMYLSLTLNAAVLVDAIRESRRAGKHPALVAAVAENLADTLGDLATIVAIFSESPIIDGYGAFAVATVIAVSSASLGYRYVVTLIGISAPRDIVGRVVKVALSDPRVLDVNSVKSLVLEPGRYLVLLQLEVDPSTKLSELEEIRSYIAESVKRSAPGVGELVIEFTTPKEPRRSFLELLRESVKLPKEV